MNPEKGDLQSYLVYTPALGRSFFGDIFEVGYTVKLDITETTVPTLFSVISRDPLNRVFHDITDIIISYVVLRYIK